MPIYNEENREGRDLLSTPEDYIYAMESSSSLSPSPLLSSMPGGASSSMDAEVDIYELLNQRERDLTLAAEIGQALLEKNEQLSKQNEEIAEEFSKKLEELEQEKYHLRRRLEVAEEEFDLRVNELQGDINKLKSTLSENVTSQRLAEKEKSLLIQTLTEQNQRLTTQLKECAKKEASLSTELQILRDQKNLHRSSLDEHLSHLDTLREEINLMTDRKIDLERRVNALQGEREGLSSTLDESTDRIVMLEKQTKEQEHTIRSNRLTMEELRATNLSLSERLDSLNRSLSLSPAHGLNHHNLSLLNEMELSDSERSLQFSNKVQKTVADDFDDDDDIECDNPEFRFHTDVYQDLKNEMLSSYTQIKTLCSQLRQRTKQRRKSGDSWDTSSSSDEVQNSLQSGLLKTVVQELKGLLHDLLRKEAKGSCLACGADVNDKMKLEVQLHKTTENYEKLDRRMRQQEEDSKRKAEEILELKGKLSETEVKLRSFEEECSTLRDDVSNTTMGKDELIKKAWEVRDNAVKRKNNTEIELARSRIDVMQINSQLLEAIQQKVELSQQLEQWKIDMQELLEEQMTKKMKAHEGRKKVHGNHLSVNNNNNNEDKSANDSDTSQVAHERKLSKLLAFFQRS